MPKKRKSRENTNKQEKLITSKLMAINYIVDDYVYNNIEISENDAKRYLQELESYKEICSNSVRCSQVIEKLMRIMKTVINENQKLYVTDCDSNDFTFENTQTSPVYSTADEDRTQLNENLLDIMDDKIDKMDGGINVIDLCNSDDEIPQQNSEHENIPDNVEVEIHKTLSSLSLTTIKDRQLTSAEDKYAKNTLANIADNEVIYEKLIKPIPDKEDFIKKTTEDITEVSMSKCSKSNINCAFTTSTLQKTISDIQSINSQVNNAIPNRGNKNNTINKHSNFLKFASLTPGSGHPDYKHTNISDCNYNTVTNELSKPFNNVLNALNQNYGESVKINDRSTIIQTQQNICVISNKEIKAQILENGANINFTKVTGNIDKLEKADNVINKKQRRKNIRGENKIKKSIKKPAKRRNAKIKNNDNKIYDKPLTKNIQVYNNTTEDNLSWIEDIKLVRDVHADEYDVQLKLEECFWDNYSLPSAWNEQDFNYSS